MSTTRLPKILNLPILKRPRSNIFLRLLQSLNIDLGSFAIQYLKLLPGSSVIELSQPKNTIERSDILKFSTREKKIRLENKMKSDCPREEMHWTEALTCMEDEDSITESKSLTTLNAYEKNLLIKDIATCTDHNTVFDEETANERVRYHVMEIQRPNQRSGNILKHMEDLSALLLKFPGAKEYALKKELESTVLLIQQSAFADATLKNVANKLLVLLGHINAIGGEGIRVLSIDGGGVRGLVAIELLRQIEKIMGGGRRIYDMFDYVIGVSTGALLASMVVAYRIELDECERLYKDFSHRMFCRNRFLGASNLVMSHAYYDTDAWETILKENIGLESFLDLATNKNCPKIATLSTVVSQTPAVNFLFRNYTYGRGVRSHFPGTIDAQVWQAIRASSAAPGYYRESKIGNDVHQDGGLLTNNPTAIGLHEAKVLWPREHLQCVLSIGTGRYKQTISDAKANSISLRSKLGKLVESATDTHAVHTTLQDLLPANVYFRLNPPLTNDVALDENRTSVYDQLINDAARYAHINSSKMEAAVRALTLKRGSLQRASDWLRLKAVAFV